MSAEAVKKDLDRDFEDNEFYAAYALDHEAKVADSYDVIVLAIRNLLSERGYECMRVEIHDVGENMTDKYLGWWEAWFENGGHYEGRFVAIVEIQNRLGEPWIMVTDIFLGNQEFKL